MFPINEIINAVYADGVLEFFKNNPKAMLKNVHYYAAETKIVGEVLDGETLKAYNEHVIKVTTNKHRSNKCDCTH